MNVVSLRRTNRLTVLLLGAAVAFAGALSVQAQVTPPAPKPPSPIYLSPPDGSEGVWAGTSISAYFQDGLNRPSLEQNFAIQPAVAGKFYWSSDNQFEYRPNDPLDSSTKYAVTLGTGVLSSGGSQMFPQPFKWSFTTGTDKPQVTFGYGLPIKFVTPSGGHGVQITSGYPRLTLDFKLYATDLQGFLTRYEKVTNPGDKPVEIDVTGLTQVAAWTARVDASEKAAEVMLPKGTPAGFYILEAGGARVQSGRGMVVYSDYGIVGKRGREGLGVWVTQVPGGAPAGGAEVTLYGDKQQTMATKSAGADGWATFAGLEPENVLFAVATVPGGETTLVGFDQNWFSGGWWWGFRGGGGQISAPPAYTGHIHTDRPIYRPGHTVHFKAVLRHMEADGYSVVAAGTPVTVTVKDSSGNSIYTANPTPDGFGSVAGDVKLDEDASTGSWQILVEVGHAVQGGQTLYGNFQVEAYVKPDYEVTVTTGKPYYVRGQEAEFTVKGKYYFGEPAAGASVTVRIFRGWYYRGNGNQVSEQTGTLGPDGTWTGHFKVDSGETYPDTWYVEAEVVDASRRPVYNETSFLVHPADFALTLTNDQYGVEVGNPVLMTATTLDHDGQPVAGRAVRVTVSQYFQDGEKVIRGENVTTGADGTAKVTLNGLKEGWYSVSAGAEDDAGHVVYANSYAWLFSTRYSWYWWGGLEVVADRDSYAPGDTAKLLIKSPVTTTALVTIERDDVHEEYVVPVSGATTIEVPIKAGYAPNVYARVQLWQPTNDPWARAEGQLLTAQTTLNVPATGKELTVAVTPDKPKHEPGEQATFTVKVTDSAGRPVKAQLSLALVDKAVLALARDGSGHAFDTFWSNWNNNVSNYDTLQIGSSVSWGRGIEDAGRGGAQPPSAPGGPQATPSPAKKDDPQQSQATPRRYFPDTAYWNARLETAADGTVQVTLDLPDSLTTWVAIARAITMDTQVGDGTGELVVSKPVQADPALPRFAVQGDQFVLDVLARNYTATALSGVCTLDAPGLVQLDPGARTLDLPVGETKFARWSVVASQVGEGTVTAHLSAGLGSDTIGVGSDDIELPLKVEPFAVPDRFVQAGATELTATEPFTVPFNAVPDGSSVEVRLAPAMAVGVLDGLEDLIGFPYGCVEQTMSRMYPNAVVGRLVKSLGIQAPEITSKLPEMMALGLQKLSGFQTDNGSWGWWQGDGNLYITAYVLHGLTLTRDAGYSVDPAMLNKGFTWLAEAVASGKSGAIEGEKDSGDPRLQAYAVYSLAMGGRPEDKDTVKAAALKLVDGRKALDPFALGALALALHTAGEDGASATVMDELARRATVTSTSAFWAMDVPADGAWPWYYWRTMASADKNTGMALEAIATLRPRDPLAPKAARWLLEHRYGRGWQTTQGTAFAVLSLSSYIVASGELDSNYTWKATLDGKEIASGQVDRSNVTKRIPPVVIQGADLPAGQHVLSFSKQGTGTLFYTVLGQMALFYDGFQPTEAAGIGIQLTREYVPVDGRSDGNGWHVGDLLNVRLTVRTKEELAYLNLEDLLPAGFEALNENLATETTRKPDQPGPKMWWRWWGYERKEIRDDRVNFFLSYLQPGQDYTFDYAVRAVTPGTFSARPAQAYAMYRPEVWGRSASDQVKIAADRVTKRPSLKGDFDRDCRLTDFDASLVAADWAGGKGRDLTGDGLVDVADVTTSAGRSGLTCGASVPQVPAGAGDASLKLRVPTAVTAGQVFEVEVLATLNGRLGGYEATLDLPAGRFEVLGAAPASGLADAMGLGTVVKGNAVRFGAYSLKGQAQAGEQVVAKLQLKALTAGDVKLAVHQAQLTTERGAAYRVTVDGNLVSPEPRVGTGIVFLPRVVRGQ